MRILLAPDKFKGTFTAMQVCDHLRRGILQARPSAEVVAHPLADGGEGTLDVALAAVGGERIAVASVGPMEDPLQGEVGRLADGTVVIESALFCGPGLVPEERRNTMRATTYGVGAALREVLGWRPRDVLIGLGGSASVDGGMGAGKALGFRPLDEKGRVLSGGGADLARIRRIVPPVGPVVPPATRVRVLCDVDNPLVGPAGSAAVFAPQKGATSEECRVLEAGLRRFAEVVERDLGVRVADLQGAAAGGGAAAGLTAFLRVPLERGPSVLMEMTRFEADLAGADLVVTGEGACDPGRHRGKVVPEVITAARRKGVPVVIVCGRWEGDLPGADVAVIARGSQMGPADIEDSGKTLAAQGFWRPRPPTLRGGSVPEG